MYKKIKNGSFMNWIWFIIAILPLCFILFSLNNEDNKTKIYSDNSSFYVYNGFELPITELNENNRRLLLKYTDNITHKAYFRVQEVNDYTINITFQPHISDSYYCYVVFEFENEKELIETTIEYNNEGDWEIYYDNSNKNTNKVILKFNRFINENDIDNDIRYRINLFVSGLELYEDFSMYFYSIKEDLPSEFFADTPSELVIQPLNYWFNNFKSNGFISNAFLNLAQFFSVTNIYYSLACYYIEYLLVIVLLHLAFDVLYMLPNICHKFMEKLGGERD